MTRPSTVRRFGRFPLATALAVAFAMSCVDSDGDRPDRLAYPDAGDPGSGPFDCSADDEFEFKLIEDFELGAAFGSWFANNEICEGCQALADRRDELLEAIHGGDTDSPDDDDSEGPDTDDELHQELRDVTERLARCRENCVSSQRPTIFDKPLPAEPIADSGRCNSRYALHLVAPKLTDWGANIGTPFTVPLDAGDWEGISFWARRAPFSRGTVRVELADRFTDGAFVGDEGQETGPYCDPHHTLDNLSEGCDRFGCFALVSTDWRFFKLPFEAFRQAGWGQPAPYLDTSGLRSVTFLFPAGSWDIWMDNVAVYRRRSR